MKVICSWCNKELGEKPGNGVTHTICPSCKDKFFANEHNKFCADHNVVNGELVKTLRKDNPDNNK